MEHISIVKVATKASRNIDGDLFYVSLEYKNLYILYMEQYLGFILVNLVEFYWRV